MQWSFLLLFWILNTNFQRRRSFADFVIVISHAPWQPGFWQIKFVLAVFVEGHLVTISSKLFSILTIVFRGEPTKIANTNLIRLKHDCQGWWPFPLSTNIRIFKRLLLWNQWSELKQFCRNRHELIPNKKIAKTNLIKQKHGSKEALLIVTQENCQIVFFSEHWFKRKCLMFLT